MKGPGSSLRALRKRLDPTAASSQTETQPASTVQPVADTRVPGTAWYAAALQNQTQAGCVAVVCECIPDQSVKTSVKQEVDVGGFLDFVSSPARTMHPMWALSTSRWANEIELTTAH